MLPFHSAQLSIRPLRLDDFDAFHAMQSNPQVMRFTSGRAETRTESLESLQDCILKYEQPQNQFWVWAVERTADAAFVGTVALVPTEDGENEIGFRLLERFWGFGYGLEMAQALCDYTFSHFPIDHLVAYVFEENKASVKILEKIGFQQKKRFWDADRKLWDRMYVLEKRVDRH